MTDVTPIAVTIKGVPSDGWELGIVTSGGREAWGLLYEGRMTHIAYGFSYAHPTKVLADQHWGNLFHFDVGREICVTRDELAAAFQRLDILRTGID